MTVSDLKRDIDLPWGTAADGSLTRSGVLVGSIIGTIAVFTCFPLGIVGIVLNCMGLDRIQTEPDSARQLIRASWVVLTLAPFVSLGAAAFAT